MKPKTSSRDILTVSQLNRQAKQLLETHFNMLWVEGEISNFVTPSSGHWYLTLKDRNAQIRCAMFRNRNQRLRFRPENGMQVVVRGTVSLYEGRGDYQIIVEHMEEIGDGALQRLFEELKLKLKKEGLFDDKYKQDIPQLPHHIGVITSPTGAAIKDILSVLRRRFPAIPVTIIPVAVQGDEAAPQIVNAIELANRESLFDVLIVGRGGGSLEDLWPFNEEQVARAIFDSKLPIVSAVGHEIDFTIADLVADLRAPTPSAAAELLSPDKKEWYNIFASFEHHLLKEIKKKIVSLNQQLDWLSKRLRHPGSRLQEQAQRLDDFELRLHNAMLQKLEINYAHLNKIYAQLKQHNPSQRIVQLSLCLEHNRQQLIAAANKTTESRKLKLLAVQELLNTVSPLATLQRGYTIITNKKSNHVVSTVAEVKSGDTIKARLSDGSFEAEVIKV